MTEKAPCSSSLHDQIDIDGGVNLEGGNILDDRGWAHDVNNSLVDFHHISVPGVGSLTAGRFSGGDSQNFRWNSNWSSYFVSLVFGSGGHLVAGLLEMLDLSTLKLHSEYNQNNQKKLESREYERGHSGSPKDGLHVLT